MLSVAAFRMVSAFFASASALTPNFPMYAGLGLGRSLDEPGRAVPMKNRGIEGNVTMWLRRGGVCANDTLVAAGGILAVHAAVDILFVTSVREVMGEIEIE